MCDFIEVNGVETDLEWFKDGGQRDQFKHNLVNVLDISRIFSINCGITNYEYGVIILKSTEPDHGLVTTETYEALKSLILARPSGTNNNRILTI